MSAYKCGICYGWHENPSECAGVTLQSFERLAPPTEPGMPPMSVDKEEGE